MSAYDPYIRSHYEYYISAAWAAGCALSVLAWRVLPGTESMLFPAAATGAAALWALARGLRLAGRGGEGVVLSFLPVAKLAKLMQAKAGRSAMWLGWGFDWTPEHTQRAVDYMMSGRAAKSRQDSPGSAWIHGLDQGREEDIFVPLKSLEGHTIMFGTTGSGKTRAFEIMVAQAVHRGDVVIVIDPKGDKELRGRMERECRRSGRDGAFAFFHPAFPQSSIRLDPLRNFTRTTEVASRIAALLPSNSGNSDSFTAFSFRALNLVAQGLVETGEKPTLKALRYYIEGGPEKLLVRAIEAHAGRVDPEWREAAEPYFQRAREDKSRKMDTITSPAMLGAIEYYRNELSNTARGAEGIDGLLSLVEHNRLHFSKMIASLIPTLNMLTSGQMGGLLSPDASDVSDTREIFDTAKMIEGRHAVYVGLDALSDGIVASAIGSILLADFASVAGAIYNRGGANARISLFVDEAAEVVNDPFIQILNKGRGAGFQVVMATQTFPDLVARTGDEAKARQIVGNANNLITLRVKDGDTQKFVVETFGETYIKTVQATQGSTMQSADNVAHFSGSTSKSLTYAEHMLFPQHLLGQLPNFHYVAALAGGRVVKGRLPILED
jgi:conjugal transfer pilus assembly protein TraD